MSRIDDLKAELKILEEQEAAAARDRKAQTPIVYRYTILRAKPHRSTFDKLYDDTCERWELRRTTVNREEALAAGHPSYRLDDGRMDYIYNTQTVRIICAVGGGTAYISESWSGEPDGEDKFAFDSIAEFIDDHPDGGDITDIVNLYLESRAWREAQRKSAQA